MIQNFIRKAKSGEPVYINTVYDAFRAMEKSESYDVRCVLDLLEKGEQRVFDFTVPRLSSLGEEEKEFVKSYLFAEVYNILSSLGGRKMTVYFDKTLNDLASLVSLLDDAFSIDKTRAERTLYGRSVNVIDRMLSALEPGESFHFEFKDFKEMAQVRESDTSAKSDVELFRTVTQKMDGKTLLGIDVGGTDIKIVAVKDGSIDCCKEYDWFPASFRFSRQLVDPICTIVHLLKVKLSCDVYAAENKPLLDEIQAALDKDASDEQMQQAIKKGEEALGGKSVDIDGIGLCFPDVVVQDKVVGGEVYKTRGIRNNTEIDYEKDFAQLTDLDLKLGAYVKEGGSVNIVNDGPMASFTAAVEMAVNAEDDEIKNGVFAHTLGTELGTGWIKPDASIPDIPLEVYNFIIDLGSFVEKEHEPDDLRSINNFNTQLAGTLQKYCSQSGIFRLAMKYYPEKRKDLYKALFDKGLVVERDLNGKKGYYVPTEPDDMRKPLLEYLMELCEKEADEVNDRIWLELGEFLAVTFIESKKILKPETKVRYLFGRLVKRERCFELICEGAKRITQEVSFKVAGSTMANSPLMKQLEADPHFTVAQFAQAVGAVYFANK